MICNDCFAGRYEYGVFTSVMWITFFLKMHGWRSDQRFAWEKKRKNLLFFVFFFFERPACFSFASSVLVQGWGRLFMIRCWYTMSMMFSNGWRGTESTLLRHLFCKTGGMDGREWVRVTGGFTRRTLVLNIWKSSCSFFFFFFSLKNFFCTYDRLKKLGLSTYFPLLS